MGEKSLQKKQFIIDSAKRVFVEKGFKNVTMKDIVDACEISRGGLYIYFDSTESVFEEVVKSEIEKSDDSMAKAMPASVTNTDILTLFFREQKKEIVSSKGSLLAAMYEYSFSQKVARVKTMLDSQVEGEIIFLEKLLKAGNYTGEFEVSYAKKMARHIAYTLEGMKIVSRSGNITERVVDEQILLLMESILPKSNKEN